jgi:hypothetical protein
MRIEFLLWRGLPAATLTGLMMALLATAVPAADLRDGLVSYWPLDVNDGGTTPDWGVGNTMTIVGAPAVEPGQVGNAFTLNGASTYLTNLHQRAPTHQTHSAHPENRTDRHRHSAHYL